MAIGIHEVNAALSNTPGAIGASSEIGSGLKPTASGDLSFGNVLKDAIGHVQQLESEAHSAIDGLMKGTGVDVHQAVIAAEKASMAFEFALAVRNKAVQSYQSIMSMQF